MIRFSNPTRQPRYQPLIADPRRRKHRVGGESIVQSGVRGDSVPTLTNALYTAGRLDTDDANKE